MLELFKNKKLMFWFFTIMGIFIGWVIFEVYREDSLLESDPVTIDLPVTERDVDYKNRVTINVYFKINGEEYRAVRVITAFEVENNIKVLEGDTVHVVYYRKNPSYNEIRFRKFKYYPVGR